MRVPVAVALPIFGIVSLLELSVGVKLYLIMVLVCISLMTKDAENLSCAYSYIFFCKVSVKPFAIFKN